jgi:hypothetical protein
MKSNAIQFRESWYGSFLIQITIGCLEVYGMDAEGCVTAVTLICISRHTCHIAIDKHSKLRPVESGRESIP